MKLEKMDMASWPRREYYQYYTEQIKTSYQVNVMLDVTKLRKRCHKKDIKFYPAMIYAIMDAVNHNEAFRMAIDGDGDLAVWDVCHPSYTIFHEDDHTFSDIWTEWADDFTTFYKAAKHDMTQYADVRGVKAKPGRPDAFTPISCVPWLHYEAIAHDTPGPGAMYFPIITFGRYEKKDGKWRMPFSIYVNHAVADGYHTSVLIEQIQKMCRHCKNWVR